MLNNKIGLPVTQPYDGAVLTAQQKSQFIQDGFLVIENFVAQDICETLMQRAHELIAGFEPNPIKTIFSSVKKEHSLQQYFLDSSDKIHFFFEEHAFNANGELVTEKALAINKIGHGLHDADPIFNCFSRTHKIAALVNDLAIEVPRLVQSMYICKQPLIGGEVTCHQDSTYLHTEGEPAIGLWFALQNASLENGCLWAIPGGHRTPLKTRHFRAENDEMSYAIYDETPWDLEQMIPLEVPQGSLILLHGLVPHMSKENNSTQSRHAYTLHVISGQQEFSPGNWIKRPANNPFRGFF